MIHHMFSFPSPSTAEQQPLSCKITALPSDVLRSQILTRLDGASLATLSCTCSNLNSFCSDESLWRKQCSTTWPSTINTRVQNIVSTFPSGHRSFFSDCLPFLAHGVEINLPPYVDTSELISAVDILYKDEVIFSKVHVTETISGWFLCSPLRIDLIEPKETILTRVSLMDLGDTWINDLEENLSLSWILIDPTRKRAGNVSTRKPISVHRHWLSGEMHIRFSTIFIVNEKRRSEQVEFTVTMVLAAVNRREDETTETQIREVSLVAEDMEGKSLGGRGSLVILTAAMEKKRRWKVKGEEEGKEKYIEFMNKKKENKCRRKKGTNVETVACLIAVVLLGFLLCFYLFIHKNIVVIMRKLK